MACGLGSGTSEGATPKGSATREPMEGTVKGTVEGTVKGTVKALVLLWVESSEEIAVATCGCSSAAERWREEAGGKYEEGDR